MPVSTTRRDCGNLLLDRLPDEEYGPLAPWLQRVDLDLKQIVHQFEAEVSHIHFPTTALISLMIVLQEDDPIETVTVGREGFVGLAAALGVEESSHRALCQMAGQSLRLPIAPFLGAMSSGTTLGRLVRCYIAYSIRGIGQGTACNALHGVEARACRWLLTVHDQARSDEFPMTQEFLARMLGVRRQSVTVVAARSSKRA